MLLDEPSPEQAALLEAIDIGRSESAIEPGAQGEWPKFGYVEWKLDGRTPALDANQVLLTLPTVRITDRIDYSAIWGNNTWGAPFRPDDHIGLTLVGRQLRSRAVDPFVKVIGNLASYRLLMPHEPQGSWQAPELAEEEVWSQRAEGLYHPSIRRELLGVLEHEPPTLGDINRQQDGWMLRLTRRLRGFEGVATIEDYVARLELSSRRPASSKRAFASPLSLVTALDYLNVVWRLRFGVTEHLIRLPNAEQTALLVLDVATGDELLSRLSALREVLNGVTVSGSERHPLERLRAKLEAELDAEDLPVSNQAIDTLVTAVDLRNGVVHADRQRVPAACARLGVPWPILDFEAAWQQVQAHCVDALSSLRELLQD